MHAQVHDVSLLLTRASVLDCLIACVLALALATALVRVALRSILCWVGAQCECSWNRMPYYMIVRRVQMGIVLQRLAKQEERGQSHNRQT